VEKRVGLIAAISQRVEQESNRIMNITLSLESVADRLFGPEPVGVDAEQEQEPQSEVECMMMALNTLTGQINRLDEVMGRLCKSL